MTGRRRRPHSGPRHAASVGGGSTASSTWSRGDGLDRAPPALPRARAHVRPRAQLRRRSKAAQCLHLTVGPVAAPASAGAHRRWRKRLGFDRRPQVCHQTMVLAQLEARLEEILLGVPHVSSVQTDRLRSRRPAGPSTRSSRGSPRHNSSARASSSHCRAGMTRGQQGTSAAAAAARNGRHRSASLGQTEPVGPSGDVVSMVSLREAACRSSRS